MRKAYPDWIKLNEPKYWSPTLKCQSLQFSIIVPVYNTPIPLLEACVKSVMQQTYTNWQLVLVDDASSCEKVTHYLSRLQSSGNKKITLLKNKRNLHISLASNEGLKQCSGEFVVFLDHDDLLAPQALNEVATTLTQNPSIRWVYSDEDLMSENGKRIAPHFKSQWNPYLLHAHNYITHLCAYQRELLNDLGGFRPGVDGAQDYDLALRASAKLQPHQITHIPKVLYHWRMHAESTAFQSGTKPYTVAAGEKALTDYFNEQNQKVDIKEGNLDNFYHVQYIPKQWPKVSIIIPTRDHKSVLEACVSSLLSKTDYADFEVIIMDNQSQQADALTYLKELANHDTVSVVKHDKAFNYSEINNRAVELASGEVIILLNNDVEVINDSWLKELVGLAMQDDVGCVGAKLLYPDQSIQHAGIVMGLGGYAAHSHRGTPESCNGYFNRPNINQVVSGVTGACLTVRKETYLSVGGLDEEFKVAYNDVDFCLKVKAAGFYNVYCAHAQLYHYESKTRGEDNQDKEKAARFDLEKARLLKKWKPEIENDLYYSPHLTRSAEDFLIRQGKY